MPSSTAPQIERPLDGSSSAGDPKQLAVDMSMSLWSSLNPGYMRQAPANVCSVATADYAWDSEEVRLLRAFLSSKSAGCYVQWHMSRIFTATCRGCALPSCTDKIVTAWLERIIALLKSSHTLMRMQVEYIRTHDRVGDRFHRRWDQQSRYNEVAALHRQVMKGIKEQASGAVKAS